MERADVVREVPAPRPGTSRCGALAIGRAAARLGAGRDRKEDDVDHAVGVVVRAKVGNLVGEGDTLAEVHARDEAAAEAAIAAVQAAYAIGPDRRRARAGADRDDRIVRA